MKKVLLLGVCLFTFSACSPDDGRLANALIGGAAGGIMGNTIGGGSGKTTASIGGAIIGTLVGLNSLNNSAKIGIESEKTIELPNSIP